jgi:tetratricopeptide (TPR) repeat protein
MTKYLLATTGPPSPRRWASLLGRLLVLVGLLALTGWNVTRSDRLDEARKAYARGDLVPCLQWTLDHLCRRPWSREPALLAARCLSRLDFPDSAKPYYHCAGPLSLDDLQIRAFGLVRGNHRQQAIKAYEEILARWPENVTALRRLAAVQLSENNTPQLQSLADRLIQSPGGAAIGYTLQGVVAHNDSNYEQSVTAFEQVLRLDPELRAMPLPRSLFWSNLADDLIKLGRLDDAKDHLTRALASKPDAHLMNTLGRAYHLGGFFDEAAQCFRQVAEWEPNSYLPWLNLGKVELQRHQFEAARTHLETALKFMPRQADVLYALVTVYRLLDRPADVARTEAILKDVRSKPVASTPRSSKDPWPKYAL